MSSFSRITFGIECRFKQTDVAKPARLAPTITTTVSMSIYLVCLGMIDFLFRLFGDVHQLCCYIEIRGHSDMCEQKRGNTKS